MTIQLKLKTEYSFGETFAPINRIIERLKSQGCTHAAIVDNNTWGHVRFYDACKEANIEPILGVEICVSDDETVRNMWFLAKNKEGLSELYRAASKSHRTYISGKFGRTPRLYQDDVIAMSDNIIKFAGDVVDEEFLQQCGAVIDLNPASRVLNIKKKKIAEKHGLKVVSTSDNAYAAPEDKDIFELLTNRNMKPSPQHILDELEHQEVAAELAKQCEGLELPRAPMIRAEGDLEKLCRDGIKKRGMKWTKVYEERLKYELDLINQKDFVSYFIVVADMVQFAKQHMLVGPSRGSAAGSLVCYLSGITEIDPIVNDLYFERFIDITRADLPDIDLDFPDAKRQLVFEYMAEKYGEMNTAHIGTITTYKPKSALITVCKALRIAPSATAAVKASMIERSLADSRANNCLEDTLKTTEAGQQLLESYPQVLNAAFIEGHASHTGVHAAGLLVCNDRIDNYATIDSEGIAHVEKGAAEKLGLLKIDVLGLRTLGVIEDSGVEIDWYRLPLNDPATYDIFNKGKLCAIFQFEGNALRSISKDVTFKSVIEIDAVTALARPGPFSGGVTEKYLKRMNGEKYEPIHPLVESTMKETFGLPVYQEQTMAIVREIGKFDWKQTSFIRKAVSKRLGQEYFEGFWKIFLEGATSQGISEEKARETWDLINAMGAWQMNKAHTRSYAVISYWTAYLKAHHPLQFAAANLRNAKDEDSALELLREMVREDGLEYIPFDLEKSEMNWSVQEGKLVGGFMNLHGFGEAKAKRFIEARAAGQITDKMRKEAEEAQNKFINIFPFSTDFREYYEDHRKVNLLEPAKKISWFDGSQEGSYVMLGEIIYRNSRDANEDANVKKRGGKLVTGPTEFLDIRMRDDTGMIGARIGRYDFAKMGQKMMQECKEGTKILVRARFVKGIRFGFIQKWKEL